jgi:hypothetical protein
MATNPRALVARIRGDLAHALRADLAPPYRARALTAADHLEGGARLPLILLCDVTSKSREIVGQTGTVAATDAMGRGRTVTISRLTMAEYALIPDDAVIEVTIRVVG